MRKEKRHSRFFGICVVERLVAVILDIYDLHPLFILNFAQHVVNFASGEYGKVQLADSEALCK
jgi:hypothetical protein